jgi:hypothetical protein
MDEHPKSFLSCLAQSIKGWYDKWFNKQSKRELILPVSIDMARARLKVAFWSPIKISSGWFFPRYTYSGHIDGNTLEVNFTVYGRSAVDYGLHGELFSHPAGTRLSLKVSEESSPFLMLIWLLGGASLMSGGRLTTMLMLLPFLGGLAYAAISWHRSVAADKVTSLLGKIITSLPTAR